VRERDALEVGITHLTLQKDTELFPNEVAYSCWPGALRHRYSARKAKPGACRSAEPFKIRTRDCTGVPSFDFIERLLKRLLDNHPGRADGDNSESHTLPQLLVLHFGDGDIE